MTPAERAVRAAARAVELDPRSRPALGRLAAAVIRTLGEPGAPARAAPPAPPDRSISVVVCSVDETKRRRIREHYEQRLAGRRFEIVQIPDARSLSEAYNRGFARSSGEVVVFSHDDIEILSDDFAARLLAHLEASDLLGVAGTTRLAGPRWTRAGWPRLRGCVAHRSSAPGTRPLYIECFGPPRAAGGVQALDGLFLAARRDVCRAVPFDEAAFDGFHLYDLDFSYRACLEGCRLAVAWDLLLLHESSGQFDAAWRGYADRFMAKHRARLGAERAPRNQAWIKAGFGGKRRLAEFHRRMLAPFAAAGPGGPPA
jgi:GT2 family glycosyltransferase